MFGFFCFKLIFQNNKQLQMNTVLKQISERNHMEARDKKII